MNNDIERRAAELEIRAKGRRLEGYAAIFGERAKIADFQEEFRSGAFADSLKGNDVLALIDHDVSRFLARTRNQSLKLAEDSRGLHFEIALPRTALANDILALAEDGSLGGASVGFVAKRDEWRGSLRTIHAADLREVSIVQSFAAYDGTFVNVRSRPTAVRNQYQRRIAVLELGGR